MYLLCMRFVVELLLLLYEVVIVITLRLGILEILQVQSLFWETKSTFLREIGLQPLIYCRVLCSWIPNIKRNIFIFSFNIYREWIFLRTKNANTDYYYYNKVNAGYVLIA